MKNRLGTVFSAIIAMTLVGCSVPEGQTEDTAPIVFGAPACCNVLDPANTFTAVDYLFFQQIYPALFNSVPESNEIVPDIAESGEFIEPSVYRVVVKRDVTFSNGNPLTASDAVFSINRQKNIASVTGPSILLRNIESATLVDEYTLDLVLSVEYDSTIRNVLASSAGLIVDEDVFAADRPMENSEIVEAGSYGGAYILGAFEAGSLMSLEPNPNYSGAWGKPRNSGVIIKSYQDTSNLVADFKRGTVDIFTAWRDTLDPVVIGLLEEGSASSFPTTTIEAVFLYLNYDGLPFGRKTDNPDALKALKLRQALETLVVREDIDERAYFGNYEPMYAPLPKDVPLSLATQLDTSSKTSAQRVAEANSLLQEIGISTPVEIDLLTSSSRWGDLGLRLATVLETQLEAGGLFEVKIEDLVWDEHRERRRSAAFDTMLFKYAIDFSDPDNYIAPQLAEGGYMTTAGYDNKLLQRLLREQLSAQTTEQRSDLFREIQLIITADLPYITLVSGGPVAVANKGLNGADNFINREYKLLFAYLSR